MGVGLALTMVACNMACNVTFDEDLLKAGRDGSADAARDAASDAGLVPDTSYGPDAARPKGTPCSSGGQCASGFCVDKVCCDKACQNTCHLCNRPGSVGQCKAAAAGTDPRSECSKQAASTCGRDGRCNGSGACRLWSSTTVCGDPSCIAEDRSRAKLCDGKGKCASKDVSCSVYRCDTATGACFESCTKDTECFKYKCEKTGGQCLNSCQSVADCQPKYTCDKNKCQ